MIGLYVLITHSLYVLLAVWATKKISQLVFQRYGKIAKISAVSGMVTIFVLIPVWDELATLPKLYKLCATEAGVHVYGKIALPKEFYSETGEPLFLQGNGVLDGFLNRRNKNDKTNLYKFVKQYGGEDFIKTPTPIKKSWRCLMARKDEKKLVCRTSFGITNGWWSNVFFADLGKMIMKKSMSCGFISFNFPKLQSQIFYKEVTENNNQQ